MTEKYLIEVKTKNNIRQTLTALGAATAVGLGIGGGAIGAAKLAGVGRFAPQQSISTTQPQIQEIPVQKQEIKQQEKKEQTTPVDLHPDTIELIKKQEGFNPKAYWDVRQYSVGYGSGIHTDGKKVQHGTTVTPEEAHDMLVYHINQRIIPKVKDLPIWQKMNDRQRGGFTSFLYNMGENVIDSRSNSTLRSAIHSGDVNKLYNAMDLYVHTTKKDPKTGKVVKSKVPGLVNRRAAERKHAFEEQK